MMKGLKLMVEPVETAVLEKTQEIINSQVRRAVIKYVLKYVLKSREYCHVIIVT